MLTFVEINPQNMAIDAGTKVIKREEYNSFLDHQSIIQLAENKAKEIVAQAECSKQQGYEEGYKAGLQAAQQEQSEILLKTLKECQDYLYERQEDIVDLVVKITRKLIGEMDDDTRVLKLIEQALSKYYNAHKATLHVSPSQVALVSQQLSSLRKQFPGISQLEFTEDERVEKGSCLLETPIGILNTDLEAQLSAIESSLRNALKNAT